MSGTKPNYPVTIETLHKYAADVFGPITKGESVTTVWVPMAGRRMWNKFLIENVELFKKEIPNHEKYLLVYIEPLDLTEESLAGYLRLMGKSFIQACSECADCREFVGEKEIELFDKETSTYSELLVKLKHMLQKAAQNGFHTVFFLGEFDELVFATKVLFNNLKSLWATLTPNLHYVFLLRERVNRESNIAKWGELNEVILQNIVYIPLRAELDIKFLVDFFAGQYSVSVPDKEYGVLIHLCGGHPFLLKVAIRVLSNLDTKPDSEADLQNILMGHYELQSVARGILGVRSDREIGVLRKVLKGEQLTGAEMDLLHFLQNLGLVVTKDGKERLFGKLFEQAVLDTNPSSSIETLDGVNGKLTVDSQSGAVVLNGKPVDESFTRQEYMIISEFLKNEGKLYKRDDIGEIIWGEQSYEKYSDWAIDQLMSKMRKKLIDIKAKNKLITIRGRGYKLVSG